MIERVLIQQEAGEFVSVNGYVAWRGFTDRGIPTAFYDWASLRDGTVGVEASTLFVGGAGAVTTALQRLGVRTPTLDDLPEPLAAFRGRHILGSTLGAVRSACHDGQPAVFVKPLRDPKAFAARVVRTLDGLRDCTRFPDEMPVLVSEPVEFTSEWRFFVLARRVVGCGWYSGDPLTFPDARTVLEAIDAWGPQAPAAYAMDLGRTAEGRTLLVEVNEGYSLGSLGLRPVVYSQLLQARWTELTSVVR